MAYEESFFRLSSLLDRPLKDRILAFGHDPSSEIGGLLAYAGLGPDTLAALLEGRAIAGGPLLESFDQSRNFLLEAIVERVGRPSYLIRDGQVDWTTGLPYETDIIGEVDKLQGAFLSIGRVNVANHPSMDWLGTCWLVEGPNGPIAITNRHVAEDFAAMRGGRVVFRSDPRSMVAMKVHVDFRCEDRTADTFMVEVKSVRYLARSNDPDIAIIELKPNAHLNTPLELAEGEADKGDPIVTIGYPARDHRNDAAAQTDIFGTIFDKKRLAPGKIRQATGDGSLLIHDASTLGGASGSPILDLRTGNVVGLHFSGKYLSANYAVSVTSLKAALAGTSIGAGAWAKAPTERRDSLHQAEHFADRTGYSPKFLAVQPDIACAAKFDVPIPQPNPSELAVLVGTADEHELRYTHFSVLYHEARRCPRVTAVNIDGTRLAKIKRGDDQWFADLRLRADQQLRSADFPGDLDRGHLVRREDPNWGDQETARQADSDTFHYTNAALQHSSLNRCKQRWLGLEDYILRSSGTYGLRVSVFTGPILDDDDPSPTDRPDLQVPLAFWKVVVMVAADGGRLHATGYILGQAKFVQAITESFEFGEFNAFQVPLSKIARQTGINFGKLVDADSLRDRAEFEAAQGGVVLLTSFEDIVL